ncbi:MAG TPA: selenocysteine-specific translation elongation factor [Streptosporangiaceae bacterium]|jgi:selenocysteine-specific elongation factor
MHVIATAGHVDHGKSTLVRALTGMQPDRWAEERRRGMTIDLGFAWTALPQGEQVAFVDVPGHERFVTNMLAGLGPVPAVMFVVAADEGWMPQSAEHLAAVDALQIEHGLLVITRADLADPGAATELAVAELAGTSLAAVECVAVSGRSGAGLSELRSALERLVARLPTPDVAAPVRLWIDRTFSISGSGTVVTGTLPAGTVSEGDELELVPLGRRVKVRAIESLKRKAPSVASIARVALNLRGLDREIVHRGMALVTPGCWTATDLIDVRLRGCRSEDVPRALDVHIGSARVPATARPLGPDTMRLRLARPLPLHVGDRALIRDSNRGIVGVRILDVMPPQLSRRRGAAQRARSLADAGDIPDAAFFLRQHGVMKRSQLVASGCQVTQEPVTQDWLADPVFWAERAELLRQLVAEYESVRPLEAGLPLESARQALGLPDRRLVDLVVSPPLRSVEGRITGRNVQDGLHPQVAAAVDRIRAELTARPFSAPDASRLNEAGLNRRAIGAAVKAGQLIKLAEGVVLLAGADLAATAILAGLPQPFTASEARQALGTSRRTVIPLLEHLDRCGYTDFADGFRTCRPR